MRLLIVEDDERLTRLLQRSLSKSGFSVDSVPTGKEGIATAVDNGYAAIILDVMLPDVDGFEVCRQLRRSNQWAPILMLSARSGVKDRIEGLESGADDYVLKPFDLAELSARIRALVRRRSTEQSTVLSVGNLTLDSAKRRAWRGSRLLTLTPKEFALLKLFMMNPDTVLTRTMIIEEVWDFAHEGTLNIVDQYVTYLRRKIDRPFDHSDLETVRGVGYRLRSQHDT